MSTKNHKLINGRLLQTDKKFSALKVRQKEKIAQWIYEETLAVYQIHQVSIKGSVQEEIIGKGYSRIEEADIWIPYYEVQKHYRSKLSAIIKRCQKQVDLQQTSIENQDNH